MRVGYDLDGVICNEPSYVCKAFNWNINLGIKLRHIQKATHIPKIKGYIITGRPEIDRTITESWLERETIEYIDLYMADRISLPYSIKFKASKINELKLETYIESEKDNAELLQLLCPGCVILNMEYSGIYFYLETLTRGLNGSFIV